MNKKELISKVARDSDYTKWETTELLGKAFDVIIECVKQGEEINVNGFGRFRLKYHKPRIVVNPKNGLKSISEDKATVEFVPSPKFKISKEVVSKLAKQQK